MGNGLKLEKGFMLCFCSLFGLSERARNTIGVYYWPTK